MDVSDKRSAAEFGANVIARSDDRATIVDEDAARMRTPTVRALSVRRPSIVRDIKTTAPTDLQNPLAPLFSFVVAAGDYVRLRSLRFASTHIHRPYSRPFRAVAITPCAETRQPLRRNSRIKYS
jgi:hypothetical protein